MTQVAVRELGPSEELTEFRLARYREADGENCGTGAGGFQPGNTCGAGGGIDHAAIPMPRVRELLDTATHQVVMAGFDFPTLHAELELEDFKRRHPQTWQTVPATVRHDDAGSVLLINPAYAQLRGFRGRNDGSVSTDREDHVFIHEIGHYLHRNAIGLDRLDSQADGFQQPDHARIAATISRRAAVSPLEFVAETFARKVNGGTVGTEAAALYRLYGGPEPRSNSTTSREADTTAPAPPPRLIPQLTAVADASRDAQNHLAERAQDALAPDVHAAVRAFLADARAWFTACGGDCWSPETVRRAGLSVAIRQRSDALHTAMMKPLLTAIGKARIDAYKQGMAVSKLATQTIGDVKPKRMGEALAFREAEPGPKGPITFDEPPLMPTYTRRLVARTVILDGDAIWVVTPSGEQPMLPGGGIDPDESTQQGAIREALEETGFRVALIAYLIDCADAYAVRRYYLARVIGGAAATVDGDDGTRIRVERLTIDEALARLKSPFDVAAVLQARSVDLAKHAAR